MRKFQSLFLSAFFITFLSCSLKYDESVNVEDVIPEFTFEDANIIRYENKRKTVEVKAGKMEQYKNSSDFYVKNLSFTAYDDNNDVETEGKCGYLLANTDTEFYELYNNIMLFSKAKNVTFSADALKWNGKTEQLTSGRKTLVRIKKDDAIMYGSGFSASGVSGQFKFTGTVTGEIETE